MKPAPARNDDTEYEDDAPTEMIGSPLASDSGGVSELGDLLLALTGEVTKLAVQMSEIDADDLRKIRGRLGVFRKVVDQLPDTARPRRVIGFVPPKPKKRRRRGK